jgi:hypothetical protein
LPGEGTDLNIFNVEKVSYLLFNYDTDAFSTLKCFMQRERRKLFPKFLSPNTGLLGKSSEHMNALMNFNTDSEFKNVVLKASILGKAQAIGIIS